MDEALLLWPGMGADGRLYAPLRRRLPNVVAMPFDAPCGSLGDHAQRLVDRGLIPPGAIVGGSSFGGFVALEVAHRVPVRGVVLIGSARAPAAIARWLLALAPAARAIPDAHPPPAVLAALAGAVFALRTKGARDAFAAMARATPSAFVRWACGAIAKWPGVADPGCPVLALHGDDDRLLPARRARGALVIHAAGHLPALTRPDAVAAAIARWLAETIEPRAATPPH